jgi:arylsulfatase A-like enzyme
LTGESVTPPRETDYYYNDNNLQAIRKDQWKLHLPRTAEDIPWWQKAGKETFLELDKPFLVDLSNDIGETRSVADSNPEVVAALLQEAVETRQSLGSAHSHGADQREIGDSRTLATQSRTSPPH